MTGARFRSAVWIAAILCGALGCSAGDRSDGEPGTTAPPEDAISRTTTEGPVRATVTLEPAAPRLGDRLTLTLEVEAEPEVTIEMPAFGEALGRFSIVDYTPRRRTEPDGRVIEAQRYTLLAPMSGRQRVPPLRIEFLDGRPGQAAPADGDGYRELLTDELTVEVESVLPEGTVAEQLRPVRPALDEFPGSRLARWGAILLAVAALAAAFFAVLWWRRRSAERIRITAYDRALRRLRVLEGRGLPDPEEADAWYVELSDIVRHYLEDRFGVRAPELTTEEFLQAARRSVELSAPHRDTLSTFLERCDRVKFAAYHPEESESRQVLDAARRFLEETRIVVEEESRESRRPAA